MAGKPRLAGNANLGDAGDRIGRCESELEGAMFFEPPVGQMGRWCVTDIG